MVSGGSTGLEGGSGTGNRNSLQQQHQNPNLSASMAVPGFGSSSCGGSGPSAAGGSGVPMPTGNTGSSSEDPSKKIRKPYTITKSRESWTEQEHDKFLEALQLFDRDWKKIEAFVGSKSVIQIRSHAQKYFLKVQKNGTSEHVPPPRPKRKAAHPYPQKASKNALPSSQSTVPYHASPCLVEPGYATRTDKSSVLRNSNSTTGATVATWNQSTVPPVNGSRDLKDDGGVVGSAAVNNCCSSTESPPRTWPTSEATDQANHIPQHRVMPDFAQVYSFIGSVFDPNTTGHMQKLKEMDPIDVETVLLLMRNLSINLRSPDFEDHRRLLSSYDIDSEEAKSLSVKDSFQSTDSANTATRTKNE